MPKSSVQELASLMFSMGRFMREHMQKRLKGSKCPSLLHLETLRYVRENGRPLMSDVARTLSITPPAATLLVDSLSKEGLIKRIAGPKDRRTVRVALTPHGEKVIEQGIKERLDEIKRIFSILTENERRQLIAILKRLMKSK